MLNPLETVNFAPGTYKITFNTKEYFERTGRSSFFPYVEVCDIILYLSYPCSSYAKKITFDVTNTYEHYHIPLLISPFSYTTYRGS